MKKFGSRGVTLVELIFVVGLMSLLMVPLLALIVQTFKASAQIDTLCELERDAIAVLEDITQGLRLSRGLCSVTPQEGDAPVPGIFQADGHVMTFMRNRKGNLESVIRTADGVPTGVSKVWNQRLNQIWLESMGPTIRVSLGFSAPNGRNWTGFVLSTMVVPRGW
jgi:hypothetical protein